jgi:exodeoxyribonuclease-3
MKVITFNVNGIRACLQKGLLDFIISEDADLVCIQETKATPEQVGLELPGYYQFWSSAEKKGYSGTLILSKFNPKAVDYGGFDNEGRTVCLEFNDFYIVNNYVPNSQDQLARIDYRLEWEDKRRDYLKELDKKKPVIMCGDLNVAHNEIDLKNPDTNHYNAGFSDQEREAFTKLLSEGFTDAYRSLYPDKVEYSWWSYRMKARERNVGWRIDYFVVSDRLMDKVNSVKIRGDVFGSDHCPVILDISIDI